MLACWELEVEIIRGYGNSGRVVEGTCIDETI